MKNGEANMLPFVSGTLVQHAMNVATVFLWFNITRSPPNTGTFEDHDFNYDLILGNF